MKYVCSEHVLNSKPGTMLVWCKPVYRRQIIFILGKKHSIIYDAIDNRTLILQLFKSPDEISITIGTRSVASIFTPYTYKC